MHFLMSFTDCLQVFNRSPAYSFLVAGTGSVLFCRSGARGFVRGLIGAMRSGVSAGRGMDTIEPPRQLVAEMEKSYQP